MSHVITEHAEALQKFRHAVADIIKPAHHDRYLLQWLKARQYDPEAAADMFRDSMSWRESIGADLILSTWRPSELFVKYFPLGLSGVDKEGCPVWILRAGALDVRGFLNLTVRDEQLRYFVHSFERSVREMKRQSMARDRYVHQHVFVVDFEGAALRNVMYRDVHILLKYLIRFQEDNYPESLKEVIVVNASWIFTFLFNIIRPLMSESTRNKIMVYDSDRSKWIPKLLNLIDSNQLPKFLGGTMMDPDGDPQCPSKISIGGEIPREYYSTNNSSNINESMEFAKIQKGGYFNIKINIPQSKSHIRWLFRTAHYDIGFAVYRQLEDKLIDIVSYSKVDSHVAAIDDETGPLEAGTYMVTFDNRYSLFRSKSLYYSVSIIPPDYDTVI